MSAVKNTAPLIGIKRHRFSVDGKGVTTLVGFHGCTLSCKYCLNPQCLRTNGILYIITPNELLKEVTKDNLYFLATGGGVTFGGGEPALRSHFIEAFCNIAPQDWRITLETSLNVEQEHIERLLPFINEYIIDLKDLNPDIYKQYTGRDNKRVIDNLEYLLKNEYMSNNIKVRLPHIPGFNTNDDLSHSRQYLSSLGITSIDEFFYILPEEINRNRREV